MNSFLTQTQNHQNYLPTGKSAYLHTLLKLMFETQYKTY